MTLHCKRQHSFRKYLTVRLGQRLLLAASSLAIAWNGLGSIPAWALSEEDVAKRLSVVPVFSVFQKNGQPVILFPNQNQAQPNQQPKISDGAIVNFFDPKDVQTFLKNLQQQNPDDLKDAGIVVSSLGELYRWRRQNMNKTDIPQTIYAPLEPEMRSALELLHQQDQNSAKIEKFPGIPLFVAIDTSPQGGYLTMQENNREVVPFFFRKQDLQSMLDRFKEQQPDVINRAKIQVLTLDRLIGELEKGESTDPFVSGIRIIPPRDALDFIRSIQQQNPPANPNGQTNPTPGSRPNVTPGGRPSMAPGRQPSPAPGGAAPANTTPTAPR